MLTHTACYGLQGDRHAIVVLECVGRPRRRIRQRGAERARRPPGLAAEEISAVGMDGHDGFPIVRRPAQDLPATDGFLENPCVEDRGSPEFWNLPDAAFEKIGRCRHGRDALEKCLEVSSVRRMRHDRSGKGGLPRICGVAPAEQPPPSQTFRHQGTPESGRADGPGRYPLSAGKPSRHNADQIPV
ncbi:hypothetical protein TVNIR_0335 [Thioalkalivibrio nitratireducens DSM 14787]|uniref:Uncharacterized protein n=1 Tax=Thioalkalivibrio nitratireducens (strain DSM 14787 / UNIQEM 213 / ALEN2) TaxID=1255043 RepID=L0DSQ4_THIND|nr:hypothetical protein TVNIR_0335 [Thioalkalivibrio nitratireducens DSM 14787]